MTKLRLKVCALVGLLSAVGTVSAVARKAPGTTLADLAGYRQWTRLNDAPAPIPLSSWAGG